VVIFVVSTAFGTTGVEVFGSVVLGTTLGVIHREIPVRVPVGGSEIVVVGVITVVLGGNDRALAP
jgi:hypothetical protein